MPAAAESLIPGFEDIDQEVSILYGGGEGDQYWYSFESNLETDEATLGTLLGLLDFQGVNPSRVYGWYRYDADFRSNEGAEYQDYILGSEFRLGEAVEPGPFYLFTNTERIHISSGPILDIGTMGIGARWTPIDQFSATFAGGYDFNDTYLIKLALQANPIDDLFLEGYSWAILDDDPWGFWQLRAIYPIMENTDGIVMYEQSTRTDGLIMFGVQYTL